MGFEDQGFIPRHIGKPVPAVGGIMRNYPAGKRPFGLSRLIKNGICLDQILRRDRAKIANGERHILRRRRKCAPNVILGKARNDAALGLAARAKGFGGRACHIDMGEACRVGIVEAACFAGTLAEPQDARRSDDHQISACLRGQQRDNFCRMLLGDVRSGEILHRAHVWNEHKPFPVKACAQRATVSQWHCLGIDWHKITRVIIGKIIGPRCAALRVIDDGAFGAVRNHAKASVSIVRCIASG